VVPVEVRFDANGRVSGVVRDLPEPKVEGNQLILTAGQYVQLELRNRSTFQEIHASVLALGPLGQINPLFPHPDASGLVNKVAADREWHRVKNEVFRIDDRPGLWNLKVIATTGRSDFCGLAFTPNEKHRGMPDEAKRIQRRLQGGEIHRGERVAWTGRGSTWHPLERLIASAKTGRDLDPDAGAIVPDSQSEILPARAERVRWAPSANWDASDYLYLVTEDNGTP
jgi:hypothetical protein